MHTILHVQNRVALRPIEATKGVVKMQADAETLRAVLRSLKTEPLNLQQVADLFEVNKRKAAMILRRMRGAERIDRLTWRVPIVNMPPSYLIQCGLIVPTESVATSPEQRVRAA